MELHEITYPYKKDIKFIKPVQGHEEGELVIEFSWRCKSCDTWNNNNFTIETHKEFVIIIKDNTSRYTIISS